MDTLVVSFANAISKSLAEEIHKQIYFVSPQISAFQLKESEAGIEAIVLFPTEHTFTDAKLDKKINDFIDTLVKNTLTIPAREVWRSTAQCENYHADVFQKIKELGWVDELGTGLVAFSGPMIHLMNRLDQLIVEIATQKHQAHEYSYPTVIHSSAIHRCHYAESFPHMLMFISRLHNDSEVYEQFLAEYKEHCGLDEYVFHHCKDTSYCLPPTMCYHSFHQFSDKQLDKPDGQVITAKGKSFRYEGKSYHTLARLCDFTIRETVFMGTEEFVRTSRHEFMNSVLALFERLGLTGYCAVGNDPFFCESQSLAKLVNQKLFELKIELNLNLTPDKAISVASFNLHDNFFGKNFNISREKDFIYSGCAGVGMERLAYAFICQFGLDTQSWSDILDTTF